MDPRTRQPIETAPPVAITGLAVSTHLGLGTEALFEKLSAGGTVDAPARPGSGRDDPVLRFPSIAHDTSELERRTRTDHRLTVQLLAAIDHDLGTVIDGLDADTRARFAVAIGNSSGHLSSYRSFYETGARAGHREVNPVSFPTTMLNFPAVQVGNAFGLTGSNTTIASGFSAGLEAIGYAATRIGQREDRLALAGGIEESNAYNLAVARRAGSGVAPAEGVGIVLLELEPPDRRAALAHVLGSDATKGAPNEPADARSGRVARTLATAIQRAGLSASDIDAIFPSANDADPASPGRAALDEVFGDRLETVPIYPIRHLVGDCFTAAGPLQCAAAVFAIRHAAAAAGASGHGRESGSSERIGSCRCALVYTRGLDHTTAAVVLGRP